MDEKLITKLSVQKNNPNRVNVYLDHEFAFGLTRKAALNLKVGQELTAAQVNHLQQQEKEEKIFLKAAEMLKFRPKSENDLRKKLSEKGFAADQIDPVIDRLKQNQWVDDRKFSELWVENQAAFRPRSKRMLAYELKRKGISAENIHDSLQSVDDEKAAFDCAIRFSTRCRDLDWQAFRKKLGSHLARRGFGYDVIDQTVRRVWNHQQTSEEDPT